MRQTLMYVVGLALFANLVLADYVKSEVNGTNQESNPIEIKGASNSVEKTEEAKVSYDDTLKNLEELNQTLENLNSDNLVSEAAKVKEQKEREAKQKAEEEAKRKAVKPASANVSSSSSSGYSVPMPSAHIDYVVQMANKYGVDPSIVFGIIKVESTFNPNAQSGSSSARGYGQFIRSTAEYVYEKQLGKGNYDHSLAYDPYINIEMIAYYISSHYKKYGNYSQALVRYNGGELGQVYANKVLDYAQSL